MYFDYRTNKNIKQFDIILSRNETMTVPINAIKSFQTFNEIVVRNNHYYAADVKLILDDNFDYFSSVTKEAIPAYYRLSYNDIKDIIITYADGTPKTSLKFFHHSKKITITNGELCFTAKM